MFNTLSNVVDVVFVPGTRTVLFLGDNGVNRITDESYQTYGEGTLWNDLTRGGENKGIIGPGGHFAFQAWAYDVYDLLAAKNGQIKPWEVRPHDVWNFDLEGTHSNQEIDGGAFDPETGRLYVSTTRVSNAAMGEAQQATSIHVIQLPIAGGTSAAAFREVAEPENLAVPLNAEFEADYGNDLLSDGLPEVYAINVLATPYEPYLEFSPPAPPQHESDPLFALEPGNMTFNVVEPVDLGPSHPDSTVSWKDLFANESETVTDDFQLESDSDISDALMEYWAESDNILELVSF